MRFATAILAVFVLTGAAQAQTPTPAADAVTVRTLTLVSASLPQAVLQRIVQLLQGGTYAPDELAERVRQNLRDHGYYNARVESPQLTAMRESPRSADVSIHVEPGALYTLGEIEFQGATVFPSNRLRQQFPAQTGALFNATSIGKGLECLKDLYVEEGYLNVGTIPKPRIDDARHVFDLTVDIDEGKPFHFGRLVLDGVEPRAGAGKALLDAWKALQDKRYSRKLLASWLAANTASLPGGALTLHQVAEFPDPDSNLVVVKLQFP